MPSMIRSLAGGCYPVQEATASRFGHLEQPRTGGHVGFMQINRDRSYRSERRAIEFLHTEG